MLYRRRMIWLHFPPLPPPSASSSCLCFSVFLCVAGRVSHRWKRGKGGEGEGAKSEDGEKAWPSIIHLLLPGLECTTCLVPLFNPLCDGLLLFCLCCAQYQRRRRPLPDVLRAWLPSSQQAHLVQRCEFNLYLYPCCDKY
jgi:hypothetical protein